MGWQRLKAHQITPSTFREVRSMLRAEHAAPAIAVCTAVVAVLVCRAFSEALPAPWGAAASSAVAVAALGAVAAVFRLARPRRRDCSRMLPQVMRELYPDFSFDASAGPDQIRTLLPSGVLKLVDGVDFYEGTLCRRTPRGDIRIYAVEAWGSAGEDNVLRQHLVYELRAPFSIPSVPKGCVEVVDGRAPAAVTWRERVAGAAAGVARGVATLLPGERQGFGRVPGSWLDVRTDCPECAQALLSPAVARALEAYFDACREELPLRKAGSVVFAGTMVYVVVPDATLAVNGATWKRVTEEGINGNADLVRRRLDAILSLVDSLRSQGDEGPTPGAARGGAGPSKWAA